MKKWLLALALLGLILPCLALAMSDEESQKLVAQEEEKAAEFASKGGVGLIPKDVIIDDMRQRRRTRYSGENILFHYGLPKVKQESLPQLAEIAKAIREAIQHPDLSQIKTYYIDGHCCIVGSAEFNCKLSWARANAVVEELVKMGVPREKLEPRGYGFYYPAFSNEQEATRMRNRRVESSSDVIELAAKGERMPCNLAGDSRSRPVEAPPTVQRAPPPVAPLDLVESGSKGKRPSSDKSFPSRFSDETQGTPKTPFPVGPGPKPASGDKAAPLPQGFKEVK